MIIINYELMMMLMVVGGVDYNDDDDDDRGKPAIPLFDFLATISTKFSSYFLYTAGRQSHHIFTVSHYYTNMSSLCFL